MEDRMIGSATRDATSNRKANEKRYKEIGQEIEKLKNKVRELRENTSENDVNFQQIKDLESRIFELYFNYRTGRNLGSGYEHR